MEWPLNGGQNSETSRLASVSPGLTQWREIPSRHFATAQQTRYRAMSPDLWTSPHSQDGGPRRSRRARNRGCVEAPAGE